MPDLLPILYQRIADITAPACQNGRAECAKFAGNKHRCCERKYCDLAARFALEKYGIELQPTSNPDLPFMGEAGCVVPPHFRPICAMHVCTVSWAAKSHVEGSQEKFQDYMRLRQQIEEEARRQGKEAVNDVD